VRRRRVTIVLTACILVGIGVVAFWPREREPKEPQYNGKKLSEWVLAYSLGYEQFAAADAIQHIGTNALPRLVRWIAHEPPAWKEKVGRLVLKIPSKKIWQWYFESDHSGSLAVGAFRVLGTNASPAVAELEKILKGSGRRWSQAWAMEALTPIGKDAFPALLAALENPNTKFKGQAAEGICEMAEHGVDISPAIPALLLVDRATEERAKKFRKTNPARSVFDYAYVMPRLLFENRPHFLIPALTDCLHNSNNDVRVEAANALGRLGEAARPAVPALKEALDVRVIAVQEAAVDALEKIAPEVLTNGASAVNH
jgi:hypothetical protein